MPEKRPDEFAESLENERKDIAILQARVQRLVARRTDTVPERKREAEELQRDLQTLAQPKAEKLPRSAKG